MKQIAINLTILLLITAAFTSCTPSGEEEAPVEYNSSGPPNGSLVIVGGAMQDTAIINRFIKLAGGRDARIVVIPTASGAEEFNSERVTAPFLSAGAEKVTMLHTYDTAIADTEEFTEPLRNATGVWFNGGRQWRLVDAYGGTLTETEIMSVLDRGGVIGGSSAGATIQGDYLVRGDTEGNTVMMGDHVTGFGYMKNTAIDQHLLVRNRQHDLVEVIQKYPSLLGIGLDENTAIIVQGNEFEVLGESFVAVYDYNLWDINSTADYTLPNGGRYFLLREGDRYDVATRRVTFWRGGNSRNIFPAGERDPG
jgi:cyanophycinase